MGQVELGRQFEIIEINTFQKVNLLRSKRSNLTQ
jgi:hypothetical protein